MTLPDVVSCNEGRNIFSIVKKEVFNGISTVTLVEVNPNNTFEHMHPDAEPITITMQEFQAYYKKV